MSEKHTPGPWQISEGARAGYYPIHASQGPLTVCPATAYGEADACLIAAAPELLAALQLALERLEALCSCGESSGCEDAKRRTILRAAIAKATGETPC